MYEYDDAGRMVRSVTRQLEPEYDDATRDLIEGLDLYDKQCCSGCGMHQSILDDFDNHHFEYEENVCPACAAQARYGRVVAERDDKATPKDKDGRPAWDGPRDPRPEDGRRVFIKKLTPEQVEARRSATPAASARKRRTGRSRKQASRPDR